jgi:hypothetical protein
MQMAKSGYKNHPQISQIQQILLCNLWMGLLCLTGWRFFGLCLSFN